VQRKRLVADRLRRMWAVVEYVAAHPGCSRRALADHFAIAERTLQADLNCIRAEMGLPLVRRGGYRFLAGEPSGAPSFGLSDAYLLGEALERLAYDNPGQAAAVRAVAGKLPGLVPAHLQPLLRRALARGGGMRAPRNGDDVCAVIALAQRRQAAVRVRYLPAGEGQFPVDVVIAPELVVPYQDDWCLIGECQQTRKPRVVPLDTVEAASIVPLRR
jgi:predicted DNA-binding transcriptional regulator YafY